MRKIFLLFFFVFFSSFLFSQEKIKIIYINEIIKSQISHETHLVVSDSIAQFVNLRENINKEVDGIKFNIIADKFVNNYNYKSNLFTENRYLNKYDTISSKWYNNIVWHITEETKIINGYNCIKAYTDSYEIKKEDPFYRGKTFAWFTTDIPIPSGPNRYAGLPGLILEITYEKGNSSIKVKNIEIIENINLIKLELNNLVTKDEIIYKR